MEWTIEERKFELKYNWKLSRNETVEKTNLFVHIKDQGKIFSGEIAPNIRYNESVNIINQQFLNLLSKGLSKICNIIEYYEFIKIEKVAKSLNAGLETAIIAYHLYNTENTFSSMYYTSKITKASTSYTIPIMDPSYIKSFITDNNLFRFSTLKLKVNNDFAFDFIKEVSKYYPNPLLVDANEAWRDVDSLINFLNKLNNFKIELIEQPLPSDMIEEYKYLKPLSPYSIFGDESVLDNDDLEIISQQFHGINLKLMKTGGYKKCNSMLAAAKKLGLKTMIGCMVESTLGISAAFNFASEVNYVDLDGFMLIKNEPFNLVREDNGILYIN